MSNLMKRQNINSGKMGRKRPMAKPRPPPLTNRAAAPALRAHGVIFRGKEAASSYSAVYWKKLHCSLQWPQVRTTGG